MVLLPEPVGPVTSRMPCVLAEVDGGALAMYCVTHALTQKVRQQIDEAPDGEPRNKWTRVWSGLGDTLLRISVQFGMTPLRSCAESI